MAYPTISTLTGAVNWSNGQPFDGYVILKIVLPTGYSQITIYNQLYPQPIGDQVKVRIQGGVYDQSARIYQNASMQPPNTLYAAYFYDNENTFIGTNNTLFTIASSPYTLVPPTLTAPTAPVVFPPHP